MKSRNTQKSGSVLNIALGAIAILVVVIIALYAYGIRVGKFGIAKATQVNILELPEESEIFLDNQSIGLRQGDTALKLAPGLHSIIISKSGFWPYFENVEIKDRKTITLRPFFVMQNPSGVMIGEKDPEYWSLQNLFYTPVNTATAIISENKKVSVSYKDGEIFAKWLGDKEEAPAYLCEGDIDACQERAIFKPTTDVRNLAFFKDRDDVIIIAIEKGVFAVELNPRDSQNLQPILEGKSPDFRIKDGLLYAKDEKTLLQVNI